MKMIPGDLDFSFEQICSFNGFYEFYRIFNFAIQISGVGTFHSSPPIPTPMLATTTLCLIIKQREVVEGCWPRGY